MALTSPIAVSTPASNLEAQLICHMLNKSGIEAHVMEDLSLAGLWIGGTVPGIHNPKIYVDKPYAQQAEALIREFEQAQNEQRDPAADVDLTKTTINEVCDECGKVNAFPGNVSGTVQNCLHCGQYMDVGELDEFDDWSDAEEAEPESEPEH
jgi:hypothetical protein